MREISFGFWFGQDSVGVAAETITNFTVEPRFFPRVIHAQFECVSMRLFAFRISKCAAYEREGAWEGRKKDYFMIIIHEIVDYNSYRMGISFTSSPTCARCPSTTCAHAVH